MFLLLSSFSHLSNFLFFERHYYFGFAHFSSPPFPYIEYSRFLNLSIFTLVTTLALLKWACGRERVVVAILNLFDTVSLVLWGLPAPTSRTADRPWLAKLPVMETRTREKRGLLASWRFLGWYRHVFVVGLQGYCFRKGLLLQVRTDAGTCSNTHLKYQALSSETWKPGAGRDGCEKRTAVVEPSYPSLPGSQLLNP